MDWFPKDERQRDKDREERVHRQDNRRGAGEIRAPARVDPGLSGALSKTQRLQRKRAAPVRARKHGAGNEREEQRSVHDRSEQAAQERLLCAVV